MKKIRKNLQLILLLAGFAFISVSCSKDDDDKNDVTPTPTPMMNIVEIASSNPDFSTLVMALQKANLVSALEGNGPFTVFAPSNAAFDAFLTANNFASLDDVPVNVLTQVLLNHVVGVKAMSTDLTTGYVATLATESTTDNPINLYIDLSNGVTLNGSSMVSTADIEASNGVIHAVSMVIGLPTVVTHAIANPMFSTLVEALSRTDLSTDLVAALSGTGPFTVFAPTNDAFNDLLNSNASWNNISDIPAATLEAVLTYHVVAGANVLSNTLTNGQNVTALSGDSFTINISGSGASITDANSGISNIIATDVQAANGVVHVIDQVILP